LIENLRNGAERVLRRPITLFTGQWTDLTLNELATKAKRWGYDGLELACEGDHFNVSKAVTEEDYCKEKLALLATHGLKTWAISNHDVGQAICDRLDKRHQAILPPEIWKDGAPEGVQKRAAENMKNAARAAANLGVDVVVGFTGSSIWHLVYPFPPIGSRDVDEGFEDFAEKWNPILDVFEEVGVKFALEVHPTEIAYDVYSSERTLKELNYRRSFGFNFDPSHLLWQMVDPAKFIEKFGDRVFNVHIKDASRTLDGYSGILSSHLGFGDSRRGWDFRSPGRGEVKFEEIMRALNRVGYRGPLSVEWEDMGMERERGAREACEFVRHINFEPSDVAFDKAFTK
jgi:sugar phosphate isomerase/epimerase